VFGNCTLTESELDEAISDVIWKPWHSGVELWYNEAFSTYQSCTGNYGEDPTCSDSLSITSLSINDHLHYFNVDVGGICDSDNAASNATTTASS
jgi:hypothetical protein